MSTEDRTAIVAVIIAVIAFFITTAQLLQALFGTAEGYRRCQPSVIGKWASKTTRKFRWSELRFETMFSTPDIRIQRGGIMETPGKPLLGSLESRIDTWVAETASDDPDDRVSWLSLLERLHARQEAHTDSVNYVFDFEDGMQRITPPSTTKLDPIPAPVAITVRTRSWDFMPPEIVRPFASSTVGDIIVVAHRLGMTWKDLRIGEGMMRAEGNGQSLSSTPVRSLGILLQYTADSLSEPESGKTNASLTVCSADADKFGFGIIPRDSKMGTLDIPMNDASELASVRDAMYNLGIEEYYQPIEQNHDHIWPFFDLIPLTASWIPLRGSNVVEIRSPCKNYRSALSCWEGFITFHHRLRDVCADSNEELSAQMRWILGKFEMLRSKYPWDKTPSWEEAGMNNRVKNGRNRVYLYDLFSIWGDCTHFLQIFWRSAGLRYRNLVAAHIATAVSLPAEAQNNIGNNTDENARWWNGPVRDSITAETMHLYIDNIPKIADFMAGRGYKDRDAVRDAWWTMIMRAMCWHRSIHFVDRDPSGVIVPSGLYDSKVPVYIA